MSELSHVKAVVHGRVQGVYYRAFTAHLARSLSIKGYVRNTRSGDVEVEAEGSRDKLEEFIRQLWVGPPEAKVSNIDLEWSEYKGNFNGFDVRY
jgi:acylphosphatase